VLEENVLNGSQKRELTNWWLTEIRKNVMAFLRSLYVTCAVSPLIPPTYPNPPVTQRI